MKNIVHTIIRLRPDRLDIPLQKVTVGLFGSAHLMVVGIPEDVTETRISLTSPSDSAFEVDVGEGGKAYVEPGMLDLAGEGTYHVWATDAHGNPTPLGSGTLTVLPYPMSVPGSVRTAAIPVSSVMDENGTSRRLLAVKDQLGNWTLTVGDVVESSYKLVDPTKLPEDAADGDSMAVLKAKINAIKSAVKASCIAVAASLPLLCSAATLNEIPGTNEVYTAAETDARINDVVTNAVKDAVLLQETDPTVPAWAKSPNPPDFSVSNDTLVATIEAVAPAPGDYATVSDRAMTAVQPGALAVTNNFVKKSGDTMAAQCTIVDNRIQGDGRVCGGGFVSDVSCAGNLFYGNTANGEPSDVDHWFGPVSLEPGCLVGVDPLFVDREHGDYRLLEGSPAVDVGATDVAEWLDPSTTDTDLDGNPRVRGRCIDLGCYESSWTVVRTATVTTPAPVPYSWLDEYRPAAIDANYEAEAASLASNRVNRAWECFVAGLNPNCATNRFTAEIVFDENGSPRIRWTPDLNEGGAKHVRDYVVEGKANLVDKTWGPTNEATRFFRVKVRMP